MVRITDFMGRVGELLPGDDRGGEYLGRRVGQVFDSTVDTTDAQREAQDEGNRARERIYAENAGLSSGFAGEFAPPVLGPAVLENFLGMSHEEIMGFVRSIRPGEMAESVSSWRQLATDTAGAAAAFRDTILGLITEGWTGLAAASAQSKVREYVSEMGGLEQAANLVANKVEEAYSGFNQVVAQMPHPPERPGSITSAVVSAIPVVGSGASAAMSMAYEGRSENAQNRAREVMETVYKPVATQSDTNVPRIPGPAAPSAVDQPGVGVPSGVPSGAGAPSPGSPVGTGAPEGRDEEGAAPGEEPSVTDETGTEDEATSTETTPTDTETSTEQPTGQSPDSTVPAGTVPSSTAPTGTDPTRTDPSRTGTPTGTGSPGSPGTPTVTPAPGRSIPGTGMPDQAAAAAARSANQVAGRNSMMGMPGMMGGARGRGDDDQEHQAPEYLRRVQEELLPQDQKTVPPVIGGE
ncbi:PPE domain-containing protein [Nocardia sp. NPDC057353]|uniref:PPE domain-containing protein n=1 Tax=Nocardia sp. NPDC057353 TaxID=3346104 RepID=UPI003631757B